MYCINCGKEINSSWSFCKFCGTEIKKLKPLDSDIKTINSLNEFLKDFFQIRQYVSDNLDLVKKQGLFSEISKNDCNKVIEKINEEFNKYLRGITVFKDYFFSKAVMYCIEKFVDSEMDYITPGIRGLGRISDAFPRFGGFYSKYLKSLSTNELGIIKSIIFGIVKYGYMTAILMEMAIEEKLIKLKIIDNELFFQKWIPKIYSSNFTEEVAEFLNQSEWDSTIYFCIKVGEETKFPKNILSLKNIEDSKLALMLAYYVEAGFLLRYSERRW